MARLAQAKARAVAVHYPDAWVIGGDQLAVTLDDAQRETILGKPGSVANCIEQLRTDARLLYRRGGDPAS